MPISTDTINTFSSNFGTINRPYQNQPLNIGSTTVVSSTSHLFPSALGTEASIPGMPLTTPINLPGMPPITVSATLPYYTLEGLQVNPPTTLSETSHMTISH